MVDWVAPTLISAGSIAVTLAVVADLIQRRRQIRLQIRLANAQIEQLTTQRDELRRLIDETSRENEQIRRETRQLIRMAQILASQAWFWTDEWQTGEAEADEDIEAGRVTVFASDEGFLGFLDENARQSASLTTEA